VIVDELGLLIGPAVFLLSTTPQKYTFDRRSKVLSSRMAQLASQDQPTVSHRILWTRGTRRHLVRRDNKSSSAVRSQRLRHSSALRACS